MNGLWSYQQGVLWVLDLTSPERSESPLPKRVEPRIPVSFEEMHSKDALGSAADLGFSDLEQLKRRFSPQRRCFVAKFEGEIAAYGWVSINAECVGEMEREVQLQPGEAYVWDCFTWPDYRRQRLYSSLLSYINTKLADEGYRRIWIGSNLENRPSLKGFANAGYRPVVHITYLRLGGLSFLWVNRQEDAPQHLATDARDAFSLDTERKMGPMVFGRTNPANLQTCLELG
ncbi:MAG: GNAT family N-acetyltransferase [Chloroflexota bacterium]